MAERLQATINCASKGQSALVLLSGGLNSCCLLASVRESYKEVHAISFNYGQKNIRELRFAEVLAALSEVKSHRVIKLRTLPKLTEPIPPQKIGSAVPEASSFVDVMLYFFIGAAGVIARSLGIRDVFLGVAQCPKGSFLTANDRLRIAGECARAISISMDYEIKIHTPFLTMNKAELITGAIKSNRLDWLGDTHSCFQSKRYICGKCSGCLSRAEAFKSVGIEDPLHKGLCGKNLHPHTCKRYYASWWRRQVRGERISL